MPLLYRPSLGLLGIDRSGSDEGLLRRWRRRANSFYYAAGLWTVWKAQLGVRHRRGPVPSTLTIS
jgi:hypothetical protein